MPRKTRIDMVGLRFGRLVGQSFSHSERGHAHWLFLCECGNEVIVNGASVRAGTTASCGCLHREIAAARLTIHGWRAAKRHDPTYRAWQAMNDACSNAASSKFRDCGARGVRVAACWRANFEAFLGDMGERPAGTLLARVDLAVGFEPDNCRWVAGQSRSCRAIEGWARRKAPTFNKVRPGPPDWARPDMAGGSQRM